MERNSHPQKNTLLKVVKANAATKAFKRVFFSPAQEEFYSHFRLASGLPAVAKGPTLGGIRSEMGGVGDGDGKRGNFIKNQSTPPGERIFYSQPSARSGCYMPIMRPCILLTIFICLTLQSFSQNEMDTRCMKRIKEFSVNINFPKFTGPTFAVKDTIKFDSSCIVIHDSDPEFIKLFELGLVFPDLIYGASTRGDKFEFKSTFSADTLFISNVKELHFPNQRPCTKSFSFLLWYKMIANPGLYFFELTDETANSKTTMKMFIEKARVTAFGFCSILI